MGDNPLEPQPHSSQHPPHNHNEGGDSQHYNSPKKPGGYWKMKKLADGTRTPMFVEGSPKSVEKGAYKWQYGYGQYGDNKGTAKALADEAAAEVQARIKTSNGQPPVVPPLKPHLLPDDLATLLCPLCYDPLIEATASSCGHVFCHECIHEWLKQRSYCPICQETIATSLHRVYAIDTVIENHLEEFGPKITERFNARRGIRLAALTKEHAKGGPVKYLRNLHRSLSLYVQSKGVLGVISRTYTQFWMNYLAWIFVLRRPSTYLVVGLVAYALGVMTSDSSMIHFLSYMWKAIINYPGPWPPAKPVPKSTWAIFPWMDKKADQLFE